MLNSKSITVYILCGYDNSKIDYYKLCGEKKNNPSWRMYWRELSSIQK